MPWYWHPLLGPVWVKPAKERAEREKSRRAEEEARAEPAETKGENTWVAEKAPVAGETAAREKPALKAETPAANDKTAATGESALSGTAVDVSRQFEKTARGVFHFKTASGTTSHDKKRMNELDRQLTEMALRASGALCPSLDAYKKISKAINGLPVYTFKCSTEK